VLSTKQEDVMNTLGDNHSDVVDKFENISYTIKDSAILINNASIAMVVEVMDVLHLPRIEEDNLVYGLIKSYTKGNDPMLTVK